MNSWDHRFIDLARHVSTWSKDPSTKVGAVIVDKNHRVVSLGYNGFPRGIKDDDRLNVRETKYKLVVHGEPNAILNAGRPVDGCTIYVWPIPCCSDCIKLVIQAGITEVVQPTNDNERWAESCEFARKMLEEAGVKVREYKVK